ncbi:MAG: nucleotidyltransferase domain-containing protein [Muribaculaceae bacterium]|nr:nucleotidyltransferase domain-containing protein [Muribaculaceae bacterium]
MSIIEVNLSYIKELCQLHYVKRLAVFGSILTERFNQNSDVDLLVDFENSDPDNFDYVENYLDFKDALERLFDRKVDLLEEKGLRNRFLISNINRTKQIIYG